MITVLRLGHRVIRDQRITTHVALTARAFGADKIIICGEKDEGIIDSIKKVCEEFGGGFEAEFGEKGNGIKTIERWKRENRNGTIIHLTMYGVDVDDAGVAGTLAAKANNNVLVIVGGSKVPSEVYAIADYNIAVGNQPHSEVAALAILLDRMLGKDTKKRKMAGAKIEILPNPQGKTVIENDKMSS
ncbi:MAG: tRNA (cytidine(56)-2'-O)-methyltransferase [Candidatus Micrarchaeia archaeon]